MEGYSKVSKFRVSGKPFAESHTHIRNEMKNMRGAYLKSKVS